MVAMPIYVFCLFQRAIDDKHDLKLKTYDYIARCSYSFEFPMAQLTCFEDIPTKSVIILLVGMSSRRVKLTTGMNWTNLNHWEIKKT